MKSFALITMLAIALPVFSQKSNIDDIDVPETLLYCGESAINTITMSNVSELPLANTSVLCEILDTGTMDVVYSFSTPGPDIGPNDFHSYLCDLQVDSIGIDGNYLMRFTFLADYDENEDNVTPNFLILVRQCCQIDLVEAVNISCYGEEDGLLEVQGINGTPPYSYTWSNGSDTTLQTELGPGAYIVTMFDIGGCAVQDTFTIAEPDSITIGVETTDETYVGDEDGTAAAIPAGGTPPYTYLWSTAETTQSISSLAPGDYSVTVTDANGCTASEEFTINPVNCTVTVSIAGPVEIEPGTTVILSAMGTGGVVPYRYVWSEGDTTVALEVSEAGTYGVTVTDGSGCTAEATIVVNVLCTVGCEIISPDFLCTGAEGTLAVNIAAGYPPFGITWSTGETTGVINGMAGSYSLTVTDSEGCTSVCSATIAEYPAIEIDTVKVTHATGGMANGAIEVTVTGGTPPYMYQWYLGGSVVWTAKDLADAIPGDYFLLVIDSKGCEGVSETISIESVSSVTDIEQYRLSIYPNPASEVLNISANQSWSGEIIDLAGRNVHSIPENLEAEIQLQDIPQGVYSVVIEIDGQKVIHKVIITR